MDTHNLQWIHFYLDKSSKDTQTPVHGSTPQEAILMKQQQSPMLPQS